METLAAPEGTADSYQGLEPVLPANVMSTADKMKSLADKIEEEERKEEPKLPGPLKCLMDVMARLKQALKNIDETEKTRLEVMVSSPKFDLFFGALILINAVIMLLELQYTGYDLGSNLGLPQYIEGAEERMPGAGLFLPTAELVFIVIFAVEVVLRVVALRVKFILYPQNWMDVFIVTTAIVDTVGLSLFTNTSVIRLVRLTKFIRLLKMMHLACYCDSFFLVVTSMYSSVGILFWAFFSIVVVQVLVGTVMSQTLHGIIEDTSISEDVRRDLFLAWGTFSRTMLTMFEITFGNWSGYCRLVVENVSESFAVVFVLYQVVVGFGLMNVLISIFVQRMSDTAKENELLALQEQARMNKNVAKKLSALFDALDVSADGKLGREEFLSLVSDEATRTWFEVLDVDIDDLDKLFAALDDGDDMIQRSEFVEGLQSMKGPAHRMDVVHLHKLVLKIFRRLDRLDGALHVDQLDETKERKLHGHTVWSKKIQQCAGA